MGYLNAVEKQLDLPPGPKAEVMRELTSHYKDIFEELLTSGTPEAQVDEEAERRLGSPEDVAARLSAVHNSASWKSAVLAAVPFLASAGFLLGYALTASNASRLAVVAVCCGVWSVFALRELARGRRPVWLATWFGAMLVCLNILVHNICALHAGANVFVKPQANAIASIGLALITLAVALRIRCRVKPVAVVSSISLLMALYLLIQGPTENSKVLVTFAQCATLIILLVYLARLVFEIHPYGNGTQASLFLLTVFALRYGLQVDYAVYLSFSELLIAAAAVWFARSPSTKYKSWAIWFAAYFWALGFSMELNMKYGIVKPGCDYQLQPFAFAVLTTIGALFHMCWIYLIVSIPLGRPLAEADKPRIAQ